MKKSVFFLFISLIFTSLAYPQLAIRHQIASPKAADSLDISYYSQKRGIRAGAMASIWASGLSTATSGKRILLISICIQSRKILSMALYGIMMPWVQICSCILIMAVCTSMPPARMDIITGSQACMLSVGVSCGRCLWSVNILLPTIS